MSQLSGRAWSEDPSGLSLDSVVVAFKSPESGRLELPKGGTPESSPFCDRHTLSAVRNETLAAEVRLGTPAVVRWRQTESGQIEILEIRAIPEPLPWGSAPGRGMPEAPHPDDRWSRANVGEIVPNVMTPFSWSAAAGPLELGFQRSWRGWASGRRYVAMYDGYVYFNFGLIMELIEERLGLSTSQLLEAVGGPEAGEQSDLGKQGRAATKIRWGTLLLRLPFLMRWVLDQHQVPRRWPEMRSAAEAERDRLAALELAPLSDREITRELSRSSAETERQTTYAMLAQSAAFSSTQGLLWAADRWLGAEHRNLFLEILQGVPGIRTQEGNHALRAIAWRVAEDAAAREYLESETPATLWPVLHGDKLPASFEWLREALDRFMDEYGHRGPGELEAAEPRWVDRPELILSSFYDYVRAPARVDPDELAASQQRTRRAAESRVLVLVGALRFGRLKQLLIRAQIDQVRRLQPLRENPKFTLLELAQQQLRLWRELSDRWVNRGLLAEPGDIYFLKSGELEALAESTDDPLVVARMASRVRRRRLQHAKWVKLEAAPLRDHVGQPLVAPERESNPSQADATAVDTSSATGAAEDALPVTLRGIAASSGSVEGTAHVADTVAAGRLLKPGAILVARFTDPGWTPIFATAAAVVTEIGGVLSHASIVARELGIPAVVNVQRVTRLVRSGDQLRVDGATGQVTILHRR